MGNLKNRIRRIKEFLLDICFPRRCPVCDEIVIPFGECICAECIPKLKIISPPWCFVCGKKILTEGQICEDCQRKKHKFDRGRCLFEYKTAASSLYRFKYSGRREYAKYYGQAVNEYLSDFIQKTKAQALVPIPLHKSRYRKRGYNQATELAKAISEATGIPVREDLLKRVKKTVPLKKLRPEERQKNLQKAFIVPQNDVKLKSIIIIDDIYTTGATMDEAAATLKAAGIPEVFFITLAGGAGI